MTAAPANVRRNQGQLAMEACIRELEANLDAKVGRGGDSVVTVEHAEACSTRHGVCEYAPPDWLAARAGRGGTAVLDLRLSRACRRLQCAGTNFELESLRKLQGAVGTAGVRPGAQRIYFDPLVPGITAARLETLLSGVQHELGPYCAAMCAAEVFRSLLSSRPAASSYAAVFGGAEGAGGEAGGAGEGDGKAAPRGRKRRRQRPERPAPQEEGGEEQGKQKRPRAAGGADAPPSDSPTAKKPQAQARPAFFFDQAEQVDAEQAEEPPQHGGEPAAGGPGAADAAAAAAAARATAAIVRVAQQELLRRQEALVLEVLASGFEVQEVESEQRAASVSVLDVVQAFVALFAADQGWCSGEDARAQLAALVGELRSRAANSQALQDVPLRAMQLVLGGVRPSQLQATVAALEPGAAQDLADAAGSLPDAAGAADAAGAGAAQAPGGEAAGGAPPPATAFCLVTPKTAALVAQLLQYRRQALEVAPAGADEAAVAIGPSWSGIVFVTQRMTAWALHALLGALPATRTFLRTSPIMGHAHLGQKMGDTFGYQARPREQSRILRRFRSGDLNLLISTSVAEEGIDVRSCQLVVRFSLPATAQSYVQSRGRARMAHSELVMMVGEGAREEYALVQHMVAYEQQLRAEALASIARMRAGELEEEAPAPAPPDAQLVYEVASTGARLTPDNAQIVLNTYVSSLPGDSYAGLRPIYRTEQMGEAAFRFLQRSAEGTRVFLPNNCPLPAADGVDAATRRAAIACAAFAACKLLHQPVLPSRFTSAPQMEALNDHLLPAELDEDAATLEAVAPARRAPRAPKVPRPQAVGRKRLAENDELLKNKPHEALPPVVLAAAPSPLLAAHTLRALLARTEELAPEPVHVHVFRWEVVGPAAGAEGGGASERADGGGDGDGGDGVAAVGPAAAGEHARAILHGLQRLALLLPEQPPHALPPCTLALPPPPPASGGAAEATGDGANASAADANGGSAAAEVATAALPTAPTVVQLQLVELGTQPVSVEQIRQLLLVTDAMLGHMVGGKGGGKGGGAAGQPQQGTKAATAASAAGRMQEEKGKAPVAVTPTMTAGVPASKAGGAQAGAGAGAGSAQAGAGAGGAQAGADAGAEQQKEPADEATVTVAPAGEAAAPAASAEDASHRASIKRRLGGGAVGEQGPAVVGSQRQGEQAAHAEAGTSAAPSGRGRPRRQARHATPAPEVPQAEDAGFLLAPLLLPRAMLRAVHHMDMDGSAYDAAPNRSAGVAADPAESAAAPSGVPSDEAAAEGTPAKADSAGGSPASWGIDWEAAADIAALAGGEANAWQLMQAAAGGGGGGAGAGARQEQGARSKGWAGLLGGVAEGASLDTTFEVKELEYSAKKWAKLEEKAKAGAPGGGAGQAAADPELGTKSYREYYAERWGEVALADEQPLLLGARVSRKQLARGLAGAGGRHHANLHLALDEPLLPLRHPSPLPSSIPPLPAEDVHLVPQLCVVHPLPAALWHPLASLPPLLWQLEAALLARDLLARLAPACVPADKAPPLELVRTALTARSALEGDDYERLETLGDAFLKYAVTVQLFMRHRQYHEGQLTKLGLDRMLRVLPFSVRNWASPQAVKKNSKVLADAMEALVGAFLVAGGDGSALALLNHLELLAGGWLQVSADGCVPPPADAGAGGEEGGDGDVDMGAIEEMLGYRFRHPWLAEEALTHCSWPGATTRGWSFWGMRGCSPSAMHDMRSVSVNAERLAFAAVSRGLQAHIRRAHQSPSLFSDISDFVAEWDDWVAAAQQRGAPPPPAGCGEGAAAAGIGADAGGAPPPPLGLAEAQRAVVADFAFGFQHIPSPKVCNVAAAGALDSGCGLPAQAEVLSDVVESLIGAVYVDSGGSLPTAWAVIRHLLDPLVTPDTVPRHPIRQLHMRLRPGAGDGAPGAGRWGLHHLGAARRGLMLLELPCLHEMVQRFGCNPRYEEVARAGAGGPVHVRVCGHGAVLGESNEATNFRAACHLAAKHAIDRWAVGQPALAAAAAEARAIKATLAAAVDAVAAAAEAEQREAEAAAAGRALVAAAIRAALAAVGEGQAEGGAAGEACTVEGCCRRGWEGAWLPAAARQPPRASLWQRGRTWAWADMARQEDDAMPSEWALGLQLHAAD
eukprot:scaffold21.g2196.t1